MEPVNRFFLKVSIEQLNAYLGEYRQVSQRSSMF
jgi:hypothetical protein